MEKKLQFDPDYYRLNREEIQPDFNDPDQSIIISDR